MIKLKDEMLGVRVSTKIKGSLDRYCKNSGVSRKHFVEEAIKDKLVEIIEDEYDTIEAKKRLSKPQFITENEMEKYFKQRSKG